MANTERRVLTLDEARVLAEALLGHRLEALYAIAMTLGLRQSEVLGLRWGDVEAAQIRSASTATAGRAADVRSLQAGFEPAMGKAPSEHATAILHVRQTLHRLDRAVLLEPPKTPRSRRDVPLTDSIVSLLLARRVIQKAELLSSGARPEHDLVFTTVRGAPLSGPSVTREFSPRAGQSGRSLTRR